MLAHTKKRTESTASSEVEFHLDGGRQKLELSEETARNAYLLLRGLAVSATEEDDLGAMFFVQEEEKRAGGPVALALRAYRRRAGLTQGQLAKAASMQATHLSLMETGKRKVTARTAKKLAGVLNCRWEYLCTDR